MVNNRIRFVLDGAIHEIESADPNISVLNYLREHLNRCGTKEGCASGDCGACTVVIGELNNSELRYKSVNSCVTFLPTLNGKHLITIENIKLGDNKNQLHPVQKAMVDNHSSQCGFCTPGFVMSLYVLHRNNPSPSLHQVNEALSGNLCRCTGYRSIVEAARSSAPQTTIDEKNDSIISLLKSLKKHPYLEFKGYGKHYFAPLDVTQLASILLKYPSARLLAGGTDLALEVTQQYKVIETLVYLGDVAELNQIKETDSTICIGAAVTYNNCIDLLYHHYPDIKEMMTRLGSQQIRNQGTIGGNIGNASPVGDMLPVLLALGATIRLRLGENIREIKVENYFIDYKITHLKASEFIESIIIPKAQKEAELKIYKISKRIDDDISAVLGAFYLHIKNNKIVHVRLAFGGMSAIPKRAFHSEKAMLNQPWNLATITNAINALTLDFKPLSDVRASAEYRLLVAKNLFRKVYFEKNNPTLKSRVTDYA